MPVDTSTQTGPNKVQAQRTVWNGEPGTVWTNDTGVVKYQFVCSLINTCGFCLQYHLSIGAAWPIPMHHGCRCKQKAVQPDAEAPHKFVDFRELLDDMPHHEQVAAIGSANYRLLKSGDADWHDIVTPTRVRDLREVVALKKLSVQDMLDAGIRPSVAEQAHASVHTPEHELVERHRRELMAQIRERGLSQDQLTRQIAMRLAERVTVAAGPVATGTNELAWGASRIGTQPHAAELAVILRHWPKPPPSAPPAGPAPVPAPTGPAGPALPGEAAELAAIPIEVRPAALGEMRIDPAARNEEIDNFLQEHPNAKVTQIPITPALREKVLGHVENWIRSGSEQDLAKLRSVLGADKLPPPIVQFYSSGQVGVPDGFHRVAGYVLRGETSIEGYVLGKPPASTSPPPESVPAKPVKARKPREKKPKTFTAHDLGKSKARVEYEPGTRDAVKTLFGRTVRSKELASLTGAPDDAKVIVRRGYGGEISLRVEHPQIASMERTIRKEGGEFIIHNDIFKVHPAFQRSAGKIGLKAFAREVQNAHEAGVSHIETNAFRVKGDIDPTTGKDRWAGYYVWPRYGYDGPIPDYIRRLPEWRDLPPQLHGVTNVSELMIDAVGREWWRKNGDAINVVFDLKKDSYSMKTLGTYLQEAIPPGK